MKSIANTDELTVYIRQALITNSQLDASKVLSSLSLTGTDLDELLSSAVYDAIDQDNTLILFELTTLPSSSNVSMEEGDYYSATNTLCSPHTICSPRTIVGDISIDNSVTYYQMYKLNVIIYGNASSDMAVKLAARLRTTATRSELFNNGIYIESISDPSIINEFKNNLMWLRNDITINLGVKYSLQQVADTDSYENINSIKIIRRQ